MIIKYYGTAAAEGWPGLFCDCECCQTARRLGGKNIRTRSQAAVYTHAQDMLLIDWPPDTYLHCVVNGLRTDQVEHLIVTHSHYDHFAPNDLQYRMEWFTLTDLKPLHIYGNEAVRDKYNEVMKEAGLTDEQVNIVFHIPEYFKPFEAGAFTVTPLKAAHSHYERCMLYIISDGQKNILYAHDTGQLPEETWSFIEGKTFDLVSLDCTSGEMKDDGGHMGLPNTVETQKRLLSLGCIHENSHVILNHFSHNGKLHYDAMLKAAAPFGLEVSYDGAAWEI